MYFFSRLRTSPWPTVTSPLVVVMPVPIAVLIPLVLPAVNSVGLFPLAVRHRLLVNVDCAVVRGYAVDGGRDVSRPHGHPWPVIVAGPVPPIPPAVPPTVVVEKEVHANTRREVDVRLGYDDHLRRFLDIHRLRSDDHRGRGGHYADRDPHVDVDVGPSVHLSCGCEKARKSQDSQSHKDTCFLFIFHSRPPF